MLPTQLMNINAMMKQVHAASENADKCKVYHWKELTEELEIYYTLFNPGKANTWQRRFRSMTAEQLMRNAGA